MKNYHILECYEKTNISQELESFLYRENGPIYRDELKFWNFLDKKDVFNCLETCPLLSAWFHSMQLRVREASFTIYNHNIRTFPHIDVAPVIAKINFPVCNTQDTYNVWFDQNMKEIDRVECVDPIVLRSDIMHTVEIGSCAFFPRIQMSFCFYKEPINFLK